MSRIFDELKFAYFDYFQTLSILICMYIVFYIKKTDKKRNADFYEKEYNTSHAKTFTFVTSSFELKCF